MRRILVLIALWAAFACGEESQPPPAVERTPQPAAALPREGPTEVEMVASMEAHYSVVILVHDALLQGDLPGFQSQLTLVADQELPASSPEARLPGIGSCPPHLPTRHSWESSDLEANRGLIIEEKETLRAWIEPWTPLRVPLIFNLRSDPYERAYFTSNTYYDRMLDRVFLLVPAQVFVADFLAAFKELPPRQKPASFSIDQVLEQMQSTAGSS